MFWPAHMSLVGPRPPVTYEFDRYDLWHKQRLLAVKPGITGLWQVDGRSRVKFDDMVRLDIRYARILVALVGCQNPPEDTGGVHLVSALTCADLTFPADTVSGSR